jgi:hypothetical protein
LTTEFLGLGLIHDEHVFNNATGAYTDANKCRNAVGLRTNYWFNEFDNTRIPAGTNRRRRAVIDVYSLSGELRGIDTSGGGIVPVSDNNGPAGVAVFNANRYGDYTTNIGLKLSGNLIGTFVTAATAGAAGAAVPIITTHNDDGVDYSPASGVDWEDPGYASGRFAVFSLQGNRTTSAVGEILQSSYGFNQVATCCNVWNPLAGPVGISAMDNIVVGEAVPVQTAGIAQVKFGWNPPLSGGITTSTGVGGSITVVPGTGGVDGTYNFTASGGGCTTEPAGTLTVAGGVISGVTVSNPGAGCYNPPSVTVPPTAALTGASVTLAWPGGDAQNVINIATVPNLGEMAGPVGSYANGTASADVHLRGLQ